MRPIIALLLGCALWGQQPEVATTVSFTEGPAVDREGNVYFTDIMTQRILKLSAEGIQTTFRENSNVANGLLVDAQNRLIACEGAEFTLHGRTVRGKPRVTRTDLSTGRIEVLADQWQGQPFTGPNDLTMDGQGRIYFTDLTGGAVYRIDAPRQITRLLSAPEIQRPNGIQVSPDDSTLYLIEANQTEGGWRRIRAFDLSAEGTVSNPRVLIDFYPGRSGDGMSIDTKGNLYVSAGLNRPRGTSETLDTPCGVHVISPAGRRIGFFPIAEDTITNNAFGGPDDRTLYITAGKTLYRVRTETPGLRR
jgi:gluconolactonase